MNSGEVIRMLESDCWECVGIKGSHHHFKHRSKRGFVTVLPQNKDLPKRTISSIGRQAGL